MNKFWNRLISASILSLILVGSSCSIFPASSTVTKGNTSAEIVFNVVLPKPVGENETVYIEIIDEVTGIDINPERHKMQQKDDVSFYAHLDLLTGTLLKYRYAFESLDGKQQREFDSPGKEVFYRSYFVNKPNVINDRVVAWDAAEAGLYNGSLSGFVYDQKTEQPLSDILIFINGQFTKSLADGYFEISHIPPGLYPLTAYHPNGLYQTFQQDAQIDENAVTPASFGMNQAKMVDVSFEVDSPETSINIQPIKLIGNLYKTGLGFTKLPGGTVIIPDRAPMLDKISGGKYTVTLSLPAGFDFKYKYTLGDGFINAERNNDGSYLTRHFIVPSRSIKIKDTISKWNLSAIPPTVFEVTTGEILPPGDFISIQFNPLSWMEPIPMMKLDNEKWGFILYGPYEYLNNAQYRFCRNNLCGFADDSITKGIRASGFQLSPPERTTKHISYVVEDWANYYEQAAYNGKLEQIQTDHSLNIKGYQFDGRLPYSSSLHQWGLINAAVSGTNSVFISPSITFDNLSMTPSYSFSSSINKFDFEWGEIINYAQVSDLKVGLFPQPYFTEGYNKYWNNAPISNDWWLDWFEIYRHFTMSNALIAAENDVDYLIIGGKNISPALPGGYLPTGVTSNIPDTMIDLWDIMIQDIRSIYSGQILFAVDDGFDLETSYPFIQHVDAIYFEMDDALGEDGSLEGLKTNVNTYIDQNIYPLATNYQKFIVLGVSYPSIEHSSSDCQPAWSSCDALLSSGEISSSDLYEGQEQARIFHAIFDALADREWISGLVSDGYYPTLSIQDISPSLRGKPAESVLGYYYSKIY